MGILNDFLAFSNHYWLYLVPQKMKHTFKAFCTRKATEDARSNAPNWKEAESNDW